MGLEKWLWLQTRKDHKKRIMDFIKDYQSLEEAKKRVFAEAVQRLQTETFVLRGESLNPDKTYRFIEQHEDMIDGYLQIAGWRLQVDRPNGIARLYHPEGRGRVSFNKSESILLCLLRLIYHERMKDITEVSDVVVTLGELQERLTHLTPKAGDYMTKRVLRPSLRKFEHFCLIQLPDGRLNFDPDFEITILPTIDAAVHRQNIKDVSSRIREYLSMDEGSKDEDEPEGEK